MKMVRISDFQASGLVLRCRTDRPSIAVTSMNRNQEILNKLKSKTKVLPET
jgi:hypothetical protein